jgi:ribonuclease HI
MVRETIKKYSRCTTYVAIKATANPRQQSGQLIVCSLLDTIDSLKVQHPDTNNELVWIPGHMNISGNKKTDGAAKETAKSKGVLGNSFKCNTLESARNNVIKQSSKREWKN